MYYITMKSHGGAGNKYLYDIAGFIMPVYSKDRADAIRFETRASAEEWITNHLWRKDWKRVEIISDREQVDLSFVYDDGGRSSAGFKGDTGDCVTRAISIASGLSYRFVYDKINEITKSGRQTKNKKRSSARTGVNKSIYRPLLKELGFEWVSCMNIGEGCKVHLRDGELPSGRLIARVSKHLTAVIDGEIRDTHDPRRGTNDRCVYGYFIYKGIPLTEEILSIPESMGIIS